jgi:hypothetical protein
MIDEISSAIIVGVLKKIWDFLKDKFSDKKAPTEVENVATRFVQLFEKHGIHRNQIPRFFGHGLTLADIDDSDKLLAKLSHEILQSASDLFCTRLEWLEGVDTKLYETHDFYKRPDEYRDFLARLGLSAAWQYSFLGSGRVTDPLSAQQIELLIHQIAAKPDNGQAVAADIMHMVVYLSAEKSDDYKAELADVCVQFLKNIDWQHFEFNKGNPSYYLKQIVEFTLKNISSENEVSMILRPFLDNIRSGKMYCNYHDAEVIKPFFKH